MSSWTPGQLIGWHDRWLIVGELGQRGNMLYVQQHSPGVVYLPTATPLAPAPTAGGLWDALKGLPGAVELPACQTHSGFALRLEAGTVIISITAQDGTCAVGYRTWGGVGDANADAVERDLQKRRALATYAAQPGWGGGDG